MNGMLLLMIGGMLAAGAVAAAESRADAAGEQPRRVELTGTGSIFLPPGFSHEPLQGIDTIVGRIQRQDPPMLISYDIGGLSGRYANPDRRQEYVWYSQQMSGDRRIHTAMRDRDGRKVLFITIERADDPQQGQPGVRLPANFAAEINSDRDVAEAMLIALSYAPAP